MKWTEGHIWETPILVVKGRHRRNAVFYYKYVLQDPDGNRFERGQNRILDLNILQKNNERDDIIIVNDMWERF